MCGMGHQVLANDVRDAAREQVESMGAQFVAVASQERFLCFLFFPEKLGVQVGVPTFKRNLLREVCSACSSVQPLIESLDSSVS